MCYALLLTVWAKSGKEEKQATTEKREGRKKENETETKHAIYVILFHRFFLSSICRSWTSQIRGNCTLGKCNIQRQSTPTKWESTNHFWKACKWSNFPFHITLSILWFYFIFIFLEFSLLKDGKKCWLLLLLNSWAEWYGWHGNYLTHNA